MPSPAKLLASASGITPDPYFRNVTLLLHGDGSNGAQNNTFLDSSSNNFTVTRNGNTTQGSFNPYGSRWSNYFDNSGDSLSVPDNAAFNFGTGDFTVEAWVYLTQYNSADYQPVFSNAYLFYIGGAGQVLLFNGSSEVFTGMAAGDVPINAWTHIAWVRSGSGTNNTKVYVNGVQKGQATLTASVGSANPNRIGQYSTVYFPGYISDLRVVKAAVYTAAFTPPIAPLTAITNTSLLTCQSNRFRDASTNNFAITRNGDVRVTPFSPYAPSSAYSATANGGSIYLDGTGDYLNFSTSSLPTTGNFTAETWFYGVGSGVIMYLRGNTNSYAALRVGFGTDGTMYLLMSTSGSAWDIMSGSFSGAAAAAWNHIAVVRNGGTITVYLNGVSVYSSTAISSGTALMSGTVSEIGRQNFSTLFEYFTGFVSNFRIVSSAVYTAAFTPPTAPVTAITNTQLLLNGTNAAIFDSAADNNLETVGNAQISTSVKKFGTGSMYFDGSGDYLSLPSGPDLQFGTGDFTVECWTYLVSNATLYPCVFSNSNSYTSGTLSLFAAHNVNTTKYQVGINGASFPTIQSTTSVSYNTWVHLAVVRSSGTITLYVNGVANGTYNASGVSLNGVGPSWGIGIAPDNIANSYLNGYIDDFRITKGVARYTANFTPPAAPFPDQ